MTIYPSDIIDRCLVDCPDTILKSSDRTKKKKYSDSDMKVKIW